MTTQVIRKPDSDVLDDTMIMPGRDVAAKTGGAVKPARSDAGAQTQPALDLTPGAPEQCPSISDPGNTNLFACSPLRRPDWRWQRAASLVFAGAVPGPNEDAATVAARDFRRARATARDESGWNAIVRRWPHLAAAQTIYDAGGPVRDELEARLLCETVPVIAAKMKILPEVILAFAATFFDVLSYRQATDWLMEEAVGLRPGLGRLPTEREVWGYFALTGGPLLLDLLVAEHFGRSEPNIPDRKRLAAKARLIVRAFTAGDSQLEMDGLLMEGQRLFPPPAGHPASCSVRPTSCPS
jgi:hypothetical protein